MADVEPGLKKYYKENGHVEFTWNGPGKENRKKTRANRRASGCGGGLRESSPKCHQ
jgi:hypothetical protein